MVAGGPSRRTIFNHHVIISCTIKLTFETHCIIKQFSNTTENKIIKNTLKCKMKLLAVLSTTVYSSHYRGGTYIFKANADGTTSIQQTQTWKDSMAGTSDTCTKAFEGTLANNYIPTNCVQSNGASCPTSSLDWPYLVGFSSNGEMGQDNDYCYGSYDQSMPTPSTGYRIGWSSRAWVPLTDDQGVQQFFIVNFLT